MSQWRIAMVDSEPSAIEADRVIVSAGDGWLLFQKQFVGSGWEIVAALPRDRVHAVIRAEMPVPVASSWLDTMDDRDGMVKVKVPRQKAAAVSG